MSCQFLDAFAKCDTKKAITSVLTYSTDFLHPLHFLLLCPACPCLVPSTQPFLATCTTSLHHRLLCSCPPSIVTVQIYLIRSAKRKGTSGSPAASAVTARSATNPQQTSESSRAGTPRKGGAAKVPPARKPPNFNLQLRKSGSLSSYSPLDTPSYRSPIKSPSQYFQICY